MDNSYFSTYNLDNNYHIFQFLPQYIGCPVGCVASNDQKLFNIK